MTVYPRAFIRRLQHRKGTKCTHRWHAHVLRSRADVPDEDNLVVTGENPEVTPAQIKQITAQVKLARLEAEAEETPC